MVARCLSPFSTVCYPCLLVRQVDQFEELEKPSEEAHQDLCRLVRQVNQFRAGVRKLALLPDKLAGGE